MQSPKSDEARYTVRFNPGDPRHHKAMNILNRAGRRKASLIAEAICFYALYQNTYISLPPSLCEYPTTIINQNENPYMLGENEFYTQPKQSQDNSLTVSTDWMSVAVIDCLQDSQNMDGDIQ